jgi:hypothetical protein
MIRNATGKELPEALHALPVMEEARLGRLDIWANIRTSMR